MIGEADATGAGVRPGPLAGRVGQEIVGEVAAVEQRGGGE
jgi:hypothetical protein